MNQLGPYTILRPLAVGGQAEILLGELTGPGGFRVRHALKVLKTSLGSNTPTEVPAARSLIAEARLLVELAHAHTLAIHGLEVFGDRLVMVLEYVGGRSLATLLERLSHTGETVPVSHALWITRCVSLALHQAHQLVDSARRPLNVVHRDVNPQNILLGFDGRVKLIDFGIAISRIASRDTRLGIVKGKPDFMSPEQAYGLDDIDHRTDIYSLGLVLYEMLTGVRPLAGPREDALERARNPQFPPIVRYRPDLAAQVDSLSSHALARQPGQRYGSAREMALGCIDVLHSAHHGYCGDELGPYLREVLARELRLDQEMGLIPREGTQVLSVGNVSEDSRSEPTLRESLMQSVYDLMSEGGSPRNSSTPDGRSGAQSTAEAFDESEPRARHQGDRRSKSTPTEPAPADARPRPSEGLVDAWDEDPATMQDEPAELGADEDALDLDELLRVIEDIYERRSGKVVPEEDSPPTTSTEDRKDDESTQVFHRGDG